MYSVRSELDNVNAHALALKLPCNKRNAFMKDRLIFRRRGGPISKHVHVYGRTKFLVMDVEKTETWNDCAGESQQ
jgi:hypothetical protein